VSPYLFQFESRKHLKLC